MFTKIKQKLKDFINKVKYRIKVFLVTETVRNIDSKYSLQLSNKDIETITCNLLSNPDLDSESFIFSYMNTKEYRQVKLG